MLEHPPNQIFIFKQSTEYEQLDLYIYIHKSWVDKYHAFTSHPKYTPRRVRLYGSIKSESNLSDKSHILRCEHGSHGKKANVLTTILFYVSIQIRDTCVHRDDSALQHLYNVNESYTFVVFIVLSYLYSCIQI